MARAKKRTRRSLTDRAERARTEQFWASPAYQRRQAIPGSYQDVDVVERGWGSLGKSNYMMSPSYQRAARNRPNIDTGISYPPSKAKVPGSIHNAPPVIQQARPVAIMKPQRPVAAAAPRGTQARAVTSPARPVAKKKAVAPKSTPAQTHSRQIAR